MRATSCLVLILGLSLLLAGGCGGGSEAASVLITLPCPNDANWDHHLAGPLAEPMSATQSTYGTARVGMAGDGSYVLVYRIDGAGSSTLHAQRYDVEGMPVGAVIDVTPAGHSVSPSSTFDVAMNRSGRFVVAYARSIPGVYYALYDASGGVILGATLLPGSDGNELSDPAVAMTDDGSGAIATWGFGPNVILTQLFDAAGTVAGPAFPDSDPMDLTNTPESGPDISMAADGTYVVAWRGTGANPGVRFLHSGNRGAGIINASPSSHTVTSTPAVSMAPDGRFALAWITTDATPAAHVATQAYTAASAPAGAMSFVNQNGEPNVAFPQTGMLRYVDLAMNADGNYVVAWSRVANLFDVVARRYDPTGAALADEVLIEAAGLNSSYSLQIAVAASWCTDNHVFAWGEPSVWKARARPYFADDDNDGQPDQCCAP